MKFIFIKLAVRNLFRHPRQTLTLGFVMALGIFLLFLGNSIFDGTDSGIEESFVASFTGHLALRANSESEFSIFGDQTPIVGELFRMPSLPQYREIRDYVASLPGVDSVTSVLSGVAVLEIGGYRMPAPLFGVDPETYFKTFPGIRLVRGGYIQKGEKGVLLTRARVEAAEKITGTRIDLGSDVQFSVADGNTFRIRSAPLVGIIEYPLRNETLDSLVLTDPATLRELYEYLVLSEGKRDGKPTEKAIEEEDLNSLFDAPQEDIVAEAVGVQREKIERELMDAAKQARPVVNEGAWNFILIRAEKMETASILRREIEAKKLESGWEAVLLDWRRTAGMSALFIYWMRMIFNAGFLVVAFATLIILIDSLIIAVLERIPEIGTMRALGASKGFVRRLFLAETTMLTAVSGAIGVLAAIGAVFYFKQFPLRLQNPFLIQLFGGDVLVPRLSLYRIVLSLGAALSLGLVGWVYPVRLALKVQPKSAMQRNV